MTDNPETPSDADLERMLLEAAAPGVPGRRALATVTAVRTILRRRAQQAQTVNDEDTSRALELVNAARGPDRQLTEVHATWVASILAEPEWAEVYASDEQMARATDYRGEKP